MIRQFFLFINKGEKCCKPSNCLANVQIQQLPFPAMRLNHDGQFIYSCGKFQSLDQCTQQQRFHCQ